MSTGPTPAPSPTPSSVPSLAQIFQAIQAVLPFLQAVLAAITQHGSTGNTDPGALHAATRPAFDQHGPAVLQAMQAMLPRDQTGQQAQAGQQTGQQTQASPQGQQQQ